MALKAFGDMNGDNSAGPARRFELGPLEIDLESYRASLFAKPLDLSPSELEMLAILVANQGRVSSREELSKAVGLRRGRSVDVLLCSLRKELGHDFIRNVRNRGWIVDPQMLESLAESAKS